MAHELFPATRSEAQLANVFSEREAHEFLRTDFARDKQKLLVDRRLGLEESPGLPVHEVQYGGVCHSSIENISDSEDENDLFRLERLRVRDERGEYS